MDERRNWLIAVTAAGYRIEKRYNVFVALDANDRSLGRFKRRYEAEAFVSKRIGLEMRGISRRIEALVESRIRERIQEILQVESRLKSTATKLIGMVADSIPNDRPPSWEGHLPTEMRGFGHAVYRALAHDGTVLYVGCTSSLWSRMAAHRQGSRWWSEAAEIDWAVYRSRGEAERAERSAIRRHRPRYNIVGLAS